MVLMSSRIFPAVRVNYVVSFRAAAPETPSVSCPSTTMTEQLIPIPDIEEVIVFKAPC
jgi:hypothetical protein